MIELAILAVVFGGSIVASAWDLKTTEIPDKVFHAMLVVGIPLLLIRAFITEDINSLFMSLFIGLIFLGFGFVMYKFGQWGGADAKLLAVMGFLLPELPSLFSTQLFLPFPLSFVINLFLLGTVYMLVYAAGIALMHRKVISKFSKDVRTSSKFIFISSAIVFLIFVGISLYFESIFGPNIDYALIFRNSFFPVAATVLLFVVWKFSKAVEEVAFRRKIPVSKLRVGDMLDSSKELEGVTEAEIRKIKRSGKKTVWIKEGVRFAPAFPIALLFTLFFGDALFLLIKYFV